MGAGSVRRWGHGLLRQPGVVRRGVWCWAAGGGAALTAGYLAVDNPLGRELLWLVLVGGACAGVLLGVRLHRPPVRRPWFVLALGLGLLAVANALQLPALAIPEAVSGPALLLELLAFPCFGVASLLIVRAQLPDGDREGLIDASIVMIALATLLSEHVFTASMLGGTRPLDTISLVIGPLLLAAVTTASLRLLFIGGARSPALWFVVGSAGAGLVGHVVRTLLQATGGYARGDAPDALIAAAYLSVALAALHPSMPDLTTVAPGGQRALTHGRVAILGAALASAPATMVLSGGLRLPAVAAVAVSLLVLLRLWRLVLEREAVRDEMRVRAVSDSLTGLPNREGLRERLDGALRRSARRGGSVAVLFIDLDGFKRVNDDRGHSAGDALLVAVGQRLRVEARDSDLVARFAGDEFVIVAEDLDEVSVVRMADRIVDALRAPVSLPEGDVALGASVGVAIAEAGALPEEVLAHADAAMYEAKSAGGRYQVYGNLLGTRIRRRRRLEQELTEALTDVLDVTYEPVQGSGGGVVAVAATLRWRHPVFGEIHADEVRDLAEAAGLGATLHAWQLTVACGAVARGADEVQLIVDVSTRDLSRPHATDGLAEVITATGLPPDRLLLLVRDADGLHGCGPAAAAVTAVHDLGVHVGIDAGAPSSSFTHLQQVAFDVLRIDAGGAVGADERAGIVAEAVVALAHRLGARVLAHDVDTADTRRRVERLGCDLVQGAAAGRAVRQEELDGLLRPLGISVDAADGA